MTVETTVIFPFANADVAYPGSSNFDFTQAGKAIPCYDHAPLSGALNLLHYPSSMAIQTKDAGGNPIDFFAANKTVYTHQNGTITADHTFVDVVQDICMVDNGSGVSVLMAVFGDSIPAVTNANATRNMTTGAWTTNTNDGTKLTAFGLRNVGPNLYAVTGALGIGKCILGEWHTAICPPNSAPITAANWSTGEPVGGPEWPITGMAPYRDRLCVGKGDGFYTRDVLEKSWMNRTDRIKNFTAHGVNGKVTVAGENCVWYGTADGGLFRFDGFDMGDETPFRLLELPRDVKMGRVECLIDRGDAGIAVIKCFDEIMDGAHAATAIGLRVFTESNAGVITELTANVTDGSLATGGVMTGWGNPGAAGAWKLVFGSTIPLAFLGVRVTRLPNAAVQSFTAPKALNGAAAWTSLGNVIDGSILSVAGVSLALTGFPASAGESIIGWDALNSYTIAAPDTYNGIAGLYWYRVESATTAAMVGPTGAAVQIDEVFVGHGRPALPNEDLLSATNNYSGMLRESRLTRVLEFRRERGAINWSEKYTLDMKGGGVTAAVWTTGPVGAISNSGPNLILLGRYTQKVIAEGRSRDPSTTRFARCVQVTTTDPAPMMRVALLRFGKAAGPDDEDLLTQIRRIVVLGRYLQPVDKIQCIIELDQRKVYNLGVKRGTAAIWELPSVDQLGPFTECDLWFILSDANQNDPVVPYFVRIVVEWETYGQPWQQLPQMLALPIPEAV